MSSTEPLAYNLPHSQKILVMIGALLALFLAALDQTIIGTAMPRIVRELNGLEHLSWVFTAYLLAATISIPIVGKLSDLYGRKVFFISGIVIFLIGSILSGLSQNMGELIAFRALQGLGSGFIMTNAFATIGDLFSPAERSRWQGLFGAVFGLSSVVGPLAGGFLTDNLSWRWTFFVNVPIGIVAVGFIVFLMPNIHHYLKDKTIDYLGAITLSLSLVPLLLGLVWGGSQYSWTSWQELALFATSLLFLIGFAWAEHRAHDPILPLHFFKSNIFSISSLIVFLTGMGMLGTIIYIPLFAQTVIGLSATNSGVLMMPLVFGIVTASVVSGQLVSRTGKYKILALSGLAAVAAGMYLLTMVNSSTTYFELGWKMVIVGLGLGMNLPIFALIVQNAFDHKYLGVVTASNQLFRSLGGSVGVAIMGGVLNSTLQSKLGNISSDPFVSYASRFAQGFSLTPIDINKLQAFMSKDVQDTISAKINGLSPALQIPAHQAFVDFISKVKDAMAGAISEVFLVGAVLIAIAFIAGLFIKEIPLRQSHEM